MKLNKKKILSLVKPEDIIKLMTDLFYGKFDKEIKTKDIYDTFKQSNYYMFPWKEDDQIVAMVSMYVMKLFSRKLAVIEEVVTLNQYRNKGVGSKLVKFAIEKARDLGCDCVELNVREDKPEVQKFYQNLGFYDRKNRAMRLPLKNV